MTNQYLLQQTSILATILDLNRVQVTCIARSITQVIKQLMTNQYQIESQVHKSLNHEDPAVTQL